MYLIPIIFPILLTPIPRKYLTYTLTKNTFFRLSKKKKTQILMNIGTVEIIKIRHCQILWNQLWKFMKPMIKSLPQKL